MIVNQLLQWIISVFGGSHFTVNFDGSIPQMVSSIINLIAYVLPLDVLIQIISLTFVLYVIRMVIAFFKTVWGIIPML